MRRTTRSIAALAAIAVSAAALASPTDEKAVQVCLEDAAKHFAVPVLPLKILRDVEAGAVGMASTNSDGSVDLGPMQINSSWLPTLAKFGITRDQVQNNPCINAYVGTWIFSQALADAHRQPALAMAKYHSGRPSEQARYLDLVLKAIDRRSAGTKIASQP